MLRPKPPFARCSEKQQMMVIKNSTTCAMRLKVMTDPGVEVGEDPEEGGEEGEGVVPVAVEKPLTLMNLKHKVLPLKLNVVMMINM